MGEQIGRPKKPERSEEEKQVVEYFARFGMHLREKFKILSDPDFKKIWGSDAKKEGWFTGYHSILETALALKIAELLKLDEGERKILLDAAMTHHAYKRIQYENPDGKRDWTQSRLKGAEILKKHDIPDEVHVVSEITDPQFFRKVHDGAVPSLLQKILAFTHEATNTVIDRSGNFPTQRSDITWKEHLTAAKIGNPSLGDDYFEIEGKIIDDIEKDLQKRIPMSNPEVPLALQLRKLIMDDIKSGTLPVL